MTIKYNFGAIADLAGAIQGIAHQIEAKIEEITADVNKLAGSWEGSGKEAWHAIQVNWNNDVTELNAALTDLSQKVEGAGHDMAGTESGISASFG